MQREQMIQAIKNLIKMELGLKARDKSYLSRVDNLIELKQGMFNVIESAIMEVFEEGVQARSS